VSLCFHLLILFTQIIENKNHVEINIDGRIGAFLALLAVQMLFGTLPVVGKTVLAVLPPFALVGARVGITALLLFVIQSARQRVWLSDRGDYLRLAALSLAGVTANQIFYLTGLSYTTASNTSLLAVLIPISAMAVSVVFGQEKLRLRTLAGIIAAAVGVIILIDPRKASFSSATTIGDLLIVLNSIAFGTYVALSKEVISRNGAFRSMMWVFIFASVICVPLGTFTLLKNVDVQAVPSYIWFLVLYIAVFATTAPYILNALAISRLSSSTVAVFIYLQPVIGAAAAVVFMGDNIDIRFAVASLLIFTGLFITTRPVRVETGHVVRP